jgi:signal transduction histidine kinase
VNPARPLDALTSIKTKLGLLVGVSVVVAVLVAAVGDAAQVPWWTSVPVTAAAALAVTQWLARGMTSPLREMTRAAQKMAGGDYSQRVTASSSDEVGQLAVAFNAMSSDLAAADQERRRLVATVSHELRTPLAAQRALLENLVDGVVSPDDEALRGALRQSERLGALVADLLDLARLDAGVAPLSVTDVRIADLLLAAASETPTDSRNILVRCETQPADLVVQADPARLTQLVVNLVDNAIRHSPPGGEVLVSARVIDDSAWWLEVRDGGPGIPGEDAERVFERFGSGGDAAGGTGLGLAIARWVCQLHGGTITALPNDRAATGALLRASLPLRTDLDPHTRPMTEAAMPTEVTPSPSHGPRIAPGGPAVSGAASTPGTPGAGFGPVPAGGGTDVLDGLWPERALPPQPLAVLGALAVGGWAALTWPERNVGLAVGLTLLAAGALMWGVARYRSHPWAVACALIAALLASTTMLRDAGGVVALSVLAGVVVAAVGMTLGRTLISIPASVVSWPLSALRGLPLLGRTISTTSRVPVLWPALRTAGLSLVALTLFGGLFASGDAVFGTWAEAVIPDLGWDTIVLRTFVLALISGIVLTGAYLALNPPEVAHMSLPKGRQPAHAWEWAVPVGLVVAVVAGFLIAQGTAMWGGHEYLRRTTGLTYAEYVHQGFAQLTTATFLTLVVVALTMRVAARATRGDRILLRALLGILCLLTLAVVASALYRMGLYQQAYGYTVLRLFVDGFELWLGLVVVLLLVAGIRLSGQWLARAILISAAVFTLTFAAMNPDAWVAQRNIQRFEAGQTLDTLYLSTLSADATPTLIDRLPAEVTRCMFGLRDYAPLRDDALAWNLGRDRAHAALKSPEVVGPIADGGDCTQVITDDYRG